MAFFIVYFAVLKEIPSTLPAVIPCIAKNPEKTVNIIPIIHLNALEKKSAN